MNNSRLNAFKKENILISPIYKLNNILKRRKSTLEDQTSAGSLSEASVINNMKNNKPNKSISIVNSPLLLKNFSPNKIQIKNYLKNVVKNDILTGNNTNNYSREISNFESHENFSNLKSRNKIFLKNLKNHNIKSTNNLKPINSLNNFEMKIQKILKKHKINPENKKQSFSPNLLIKSTDITKKRYYFGFMNSEKSSLIDENNEKNVDIKNKLLLSEKKHNISLSINKKKIPPIKLNKKRRIKYTIDQLLKKKFKNINEKKFLFKTIQNQKKKLKPLKINSKLPEVKKKITFQDKLIRNNRKIGFKSLSNSNLKSQSEKDLINLKPSSFRNPLKKKSSKSMKSVKFKETPVNISILLEKKKTIRDEKRKKTEKKLSMKKMNESQYGYNFEDEENDSIIEYEDDYFNTDSEEEKKKKKILKEKKKFRIRISSSTLILSKQIIKSYEYFNLKKQEKKFLIKLHPENLLIKKAMTSNYSQILTNTKTYIYNKIKPKEQNTIKNFKYTEEMFITSNHDKKDMIEFAKINKNDIYGYKEYRNMGLNFATAFHLMNLYIPMSPQIIANFLSAKPEQKDKDYKYLFRSSKNLRKRKSLPDISLQILYDFLVVSQENLIFYQKFIYRDYGILLFDNFEDILKQINESDEEKDNESDFRKTLRSPRKKKRKVHLEILRKKPFFKMEGKQRQIMVSLLDDFIKSEDETIRVLVENIQLMLTHNSPKLVQTIIMLFDYCIRNQSYTLFIRFHHRYHNYFDLDTPDHFYNGDTLLIKATKNNCKIIVKYLLEKGANPNIKNDFGNTAMHYALSYKYFNIADILRKNGGREDIENKKGLIPWECVNGTCD